MNKLLEFLVLLLYLMIGFVSLYFVFYGLMIETMFLLIFSIILLFIIIKLAQKKPDDAPVPGEVDT